MLTVCEFLNRDNKLGAEKTFIVHNCLLTWNRMVSIYQSHKLYHLISVPPQFIPTLSSTCKRNSTTSEKPYCEARCSAESSLSFCWLTLAREGPWVTSILTISRSPFHAAKCSGQLPELSEIVVEAPQQRRRFTVSL